VTESEWLTTDRCAMYSGVDYLREKGLASPRKLRLLACAYMRRQWERLVDPRSRAVVEVAEAFADGLRSRQEMQEAAARAEEAAEELKQFDSQREERDSWEPQNRAELAIAAHELAVVVLSQPDGATDGTGALAKAVADHAATLADVVGMIAGRGASTEELNAILDAEVRAHAVLVREVFGNPFQMVPFNPAMRTETVKSMGETVYSRADFSGLPVLADALEEAGSSTDAFLDHFRLPGPHVRGCWALDLVLGKC
jgi:hypothetical protein